MAELKNSFSQRRFFTKLQFQIVEDGVKVDFKNLFSSESYKVPFENILPEAYEYTVSSRTAFIIMFILLSLAAITGILLGFGQDVEYSAPIIWGVLGIIAAIVFLISRHHYLMFSQNINDTSPLVLYKDKPNRDSVTEFMTVVQANKKEYLRQYGKNEYSYAQETENSMKMGVIKKDLTQEELILLKTCIQKHRPDLLPAFSRLDTEMPDLETVHAMRNDAVRTELAKEGFLQDSSSIEYGQKLESLINRLADLYIWPYQ